MPCLKRLIPTAILFAIGTGSAIAADDEPAAKSFSVLAGIKVTPMAASELDTVRGAHVHFLDPNGGFHLAGNPGNNGIGTGNWYNNGSPDSVENGALVAPSYHGLCVAAGTPSGIQIPPSGPDGPTLAQCP
jgi:hypothetical protein